VVPLAEDPDLTPQRGTGSGGERQVVEWTVFERGRDASSLQVGLIGIAEQNGGGAPGRAGRDAKAARRRLVVVTRTGAGESGTRRTDGGTDTSGFSRLGRAQEGTGDAESGKHAGYALHGPTSWHESQGGSGAPMAEETAHRVGQR